MHLTRRGFLAFLGATAAMSQPAPASAWVSKAPTNPFGCLVDVTGASAVANAKMACNQVNIFRNPKPVRDPLRPQHQNAPHHHGYTVVNSYTQQAGHPEQAVPSFVKIQCMHCQDPACVSACITGALSKLENGTVHYDVSRCIGCRYCMVACPFEIPAYDYHDPLTPQVRKCTFCLDRLKEGKPPGCPRSVRPRP
jgi:Fe-S-cluster-containing dehydrogenase component